MSHKDGADVEVVIKDQTQNCRNTHTTLIEKLPRFWTDKQHHPIRKENQNMKFLSLFWVLASLLPLVACHNVLLHPRGKTCFFETMKVNDVLAVTFQVGNRDPSHQDQLTADFNVSLLTVFCLQYIFIEVWLK